MQPSEPPAGWLRPYRNIAKLRSNFCRTPVKRRAQAVLETGVEPHGDARPSHQILR
jgi:hypothetical protein